MPKRDPNAASFLPMIFVILLRVPRIFIPLCEAAIPIIVNMQLPRELAVRSVGENPDSAQNRGINPEKIRLLATVIGGLIIGFGGAAFSLHAKFGWSENHTGNYGWICLAIVIFGGWNPVRAAIGAYSFGAFQLIALKLQSVALGLTQVLPLIPFPLMILTLIFIQRFNRSKNNKELPGLLKIFFGGQEPESLGKPIEKK